MKHLIFIVYIVCSSFMVRAQSGKLDSLTQLLRQIPERSYTFVFEQSRQQLDLLDSAAAFRYVHRIRQLTAKIPSPYFQAYVYRTEALVYEKYENTPQAFNRLSEALTWVKRMSHPDIEADILLTMGMLCRDHYRYSEAAIHLLQAQKLYTKTSQQTAKAQTLYQLGLVYYASRKYPESLECLQQVYTLGKDSLDKRTIISTINTMGLACKNLKYYSKAIAYFIQSLHWAETYQDSAWIGLVNGNMGTVYELQGNYDRAIAHYQTDLKLSRQYKEWGSVVSLLSTLGNIEVQKGKYTAAELYFKEALTVAETHAVFEQKESLFKYLSDYYQKQANYTQAYAYLRQYQTIRDSVLRRTNQIELSRIQATFNVEKKQTEIELLRKDNQLIRASQANQQLLTLAVLIISGLFGVLSILLYRSSRKQQKTNDALLLHQEELQEKNDEIKKLNNNLDKAVKSRTRQLEVALDNLTKQHHDLEQFSYIISHNLKSPISHITGLVSVFNQRNPSDPSNILILESLNKATHNLNDVVQDLNELLTYRNNIEQAVEEVHFEEIVTAVQENLYQQIMQSQTRIEVDFSAHESIYSIKSYIHSIIYNLISNAIKYCSPKRQPIIELRTEIINDQICLSVADNGLGMDFNQVDSNKIFGLYQRIHLNVEGKGLGLYLVKSQIEALGGSITVESQLDVGTIFRIYLKDKEKNN